MTINRRSILIGGASVAGGIAAGGYALNAQTAPSFVVPLPLPRHVDLTRGGDAFDLVIQEGRT